MFAAIERLEYEAFDAACERYNIDTDEFTNRTPPRSNCVSWRRGQDRGAACPNARGTGAASLRAFQTEPLPPHDPLASAAARYGVR